MFRPENNTQLPEPEFGSAWLQAAEPAQACIEVFGKWAVERFENESLAKPKLTALLPAVQYVLEVGYEKDINMRAFLQSEAYHRAMSWLCIKSDRERITKNSATLHHTDRWLEILNAYDDISTLENIVVGAPSVDDELYRKVLPYLQDRSRISGAESFSLHDALVEIERKRPHRIIQREIERSAKGQLAAYYESAGILADVGFDFKLIEEIWKDMQNTTDHLYQACDPHNHKWIQDELNPGRLMDEYARLTLVREAMYGRGTSLAAIKAFGLTTLPYMLPTAARRMMALACNEKNELARIRQAHQQDNIRLVIAYNNIDHNNAYRDLSSSVFEHTDMYTVYVSVRDPFDPPLIADYFVDNYGIGVKKLVIDTHGDRGSFDAGWYKNFRAQIGEVSRAVDEKSAIELDMAEDKAIISPQHFLGWLAVHGIVSSESLLVLASCYGDTIAPEVAEAAQLTVLAAVEKTGLTYDQAKGGTAFLTPSVALRPDGSQIAELPVSP